MSRRSSYRCNISSGGGTATRQSDEYRSEDKLSGFSHQENSVRACSIQRRNPIFEFRFDSDCKRQFPVRLDNL